MAKSGGGGSRMMRERDRRGENLASLVRFGNRRAAPNASTDDLLSAYGYLNRKPNQTSRDLSARAIISRELDKR